MSAHPQSKPSLYDQLCELPEGLRGEIINGQLRTQPRPGGPHSLATSRVVGDLEAPFGRGRGGPGGWWILNEPEVHFVRDREVVVPDLAGWRRERMPRLPEGHRFEVVPDWVCEVLSSSTKSTDREEKMPLYARYGVAYAWLVDPKTRTLEAYRLADDAWLPIAVYRDDDEARVPPFDAIVIRLSDLWD